MYKLKLLSLLAFILLISGVSSAYSLSHFALTGTSSENLTITIPYTIEPKIGNDLLTAGDEIGVFDSEGNCWGAGAWIGGNNSIAISVFGFVEGDESLGIPDEPGMPVGELMKFRIWDNETNTEYNVVSATVQSGNLKYATNKILFLTSLQAYLVPAVPNITNPTNNSVMVSLSGNLTWDATANTDSYDYTLSANSDFSNPLLDGNTTSTSVAYTSLNNGTVYYFRVRGKNSVGNGNYATSTFTTILPQVTLTSPADNSKAQPLSGTLSWNTVSGATAYEVIIATDIAFNSVVASETTSSNSYSYSGLLNYTNYYWKVRAKNGANLGTYSTIFTFQTLLSAPVITNPLNNAVGVAVSGNFAWTAVTGATFYSIQVSTDAGFGSFVYNAANVSATNFAYSGLANNTTYYVRVKANNSDGSGNWSLSQFKTVVATPTNISPINNAFSQPLNGTLQWSSVTGATAYEVEMSTNSAFTNIILSNMNVAGNSFSYSGLNNATQYYWRVRAKNSEGTSANSNYTSFTTLIGKATLVSPSNNATNVNAVSGNFTWTGPTTATKYRIQVSKVANFATTIYDQSDITTNSFAYSNLESKVVYYWKVYSYSANNDGSWSDVFSFTSGLAKPTLASPANNAQGLMNGTTLSWNALNGAVSYRVIVSKNSDLSSPISEVYGIEDLSYGTYGLQYNATYYWGVRGHDDSGDGPLSDIWSFGTLVDKPTLVAPANNDVDVPLSGTFSWNSVAGATEYQIQVSEVSDFSTTVVDVSNISSTSYNYANLTNNTDHYWRVRGYKAGQPGVWSDTWSFKTIKLLPPDLVSPVNNKIDVYFDVTLDWNAANQATAYDVQIATDNAFTHIVAEGTDITNTYFDVTGLSYQTTYYWRARSKNLLGSSNWSATWSFNTIKYPNFAGVDDVCENQEASYSTDESAVIDYSWSVVGGTIIGSSTEKSVVVKWTSAGLRTITLNRSSAEWGEFTDSKELDVTVHPRDTVNVTIAPTTYYTGKICVKESVKYSATFDKTGINEYYWYVGGNLVGTGATLNYSFDSAGTYYVALEVFGPGCKNGQGLYEVVVTENCNLTVLVNDFSACKNSSPTINTTVFGLTGKYGFYWTPAADFVNANLQNPTVKNAVIGKKFAFKVTDLNKNISVSKSVTMTIQQGPTIGFNKLFYTVRNTDPVDLTDEDVLKVTINGGTAPYNYKWTDNNGNVIDPTEIYPPLGSSKYWLTVTDASGCTSAEKSFSIIRYPNKDIYDYAMPGIAGQGYMLAYPNPATDFINIYADFASSTEATLKVYDIKGNLVFFTNIAETKQYEGQINVSSLTSGSYTIVIETFEDTIINRFIKK